MGVRRCEKRGCACKENPAAILELQRRNAWAEGGCSRARIAIAQIMIHRKPNLLNVGKSVLKLEEELANGPS